jgi:hypothetical protein
MYKVYIKCWHQESGEQEEIMFSSENIEDCWEFLVKHGLNYIENYPIIEIGIKN